MQPGADNFELACGLHVIWSYLECLIIVPIQHLHLSYYNNQAKY